jgi:hypothetical protein
LPDGVISGSATESSVRDMDCELRCDCGYTAHGADESELVAQIRDHAWQTHRMALTDAQAHLLLRRDASTWLAEA